MGEKLPSPQLPPELAWAIPLKSIAARALAVDPYQRFADCAELATAIAIVARERVATHAEIAAFFGSKKRIAPVGCAAAADPHAQLHLPSVRLPVAPVSVRAPASSRNGFPLATPAPRSVTPAPQPVTRAPASSQRGSGSLTSGGASSQGGSGSLTTAPRSVATASSSRDPDSVASAPSSSPRAPDRSRTRPPHRRALLIR